MSTPASAFRLAERQRTLDAEATRSLPALAAEKRRKQAASAHGLFRGSAPLFYEILAERPELAAGPEGEGFIVGDMHVENVGAYKSDAGDVVFDLNDFDDATVGPLRFDVLRLSTSFLLAARALTDAGAQALALVEAMLDAYARQLAAAGRAEPPPLPRRIAELVARAEARTRRQLLDERAPRRKGGRRFERGARYLDAPEAVAEAAPRLFARYLEGLGGSAPPRAAAWQIEDVALRVAGTGSLGRLRLALLIGADGAAPRLVELKEARASAVHAFCPAGVTWPSEAERVVRAACALAAEPPRGLAHANDEALGVSLVGRRLTPQDDKLDLAATHAGARLRGFSRSVGDVLGRAHARGLRSATGLAWSKADLGGVLERAIELAGLFEAIYLAYVRLAMGDGA